MPSEKQYLERRENIAAILQYIRANGAKSRRQIADDLELSWGCVSELVSILLMQDILKEQEVEVIKAKGRTPMVLTLNNDICFLGIDINLNGLRGCVCNLSGEKIDSFEGVLNCDSKEAFVETVGSFVDEITNKHKEIRGVGFAMQGIFNAKRQVWNFPAKPNFEVHFKNDFAHRLSLPFLVEHDPNCILYGCLDTTCNNTMVVRLDSGIGAAIYTNNAFLKNDLLEIGHIVVNEQGERLHDKVSIKAMEKACGKSIDICDSAAQHFFEDVGKYLGITLGNVCNLFALDKIVICGDITNYYPLFSTTLMQYYTRTAISTQKAEIAAINVTDAAYGAAKMAIDKFQY